MTNEEIRAACFRATSLSNDVEDESLRNTAFGSILAALLSGTTKGDSFATGVESQRKNMATKSKGKRREGLKSRLEGLVEANFFIEPRSVADIGAELKVAGWNHNVSEISARLIDLTRAKRIRRAPSASGLQYSNW